MFAYYFNKSTVFTNNAQLLRPHMTMATQKSCNLIDANL